MTALSLSRATNAFGPNARILIFGVGFFFVDASPPASAADSAPLVLETKIPLGTVRGRIDHMAYDAGRQYLYVAELGNGSVGVVDLKQRRVVRTIDGLREPQGIGYVPSTDTIYVASAGDGSVKLFQGADFRPLGTIALGEDADNVRVDDAAHRVFVGYGSGALAVINTTTRKKVADIILTAHPESFQLESAGERIFVNVPDAHEIAVVDRGTNRRVATWATGDLRANFPLALDEPHHQVLLVFRHPPKLRRVRRSQWSTARCGGHLSGLRRRLRRCKAKPRVCQLRRGLRRRAGSEGSGIRGTRTHRDGRRCADSAVRTCDRQAGGRRSRDGDRARRSVGVPASPVRMVNAIRAQQFSPCGTS
jgi:YVTN family beta-propeller protein